MTLISSNWLYSGLQLTWNIYTCKNKSQITHPSTVYSTVIASRLSLIESLEIGSDQSEASVSHMTSTMDDSDWSG